MFADINGITISTNNRQLFSALDKLTGKEAQKVVRKAVGSGASIIVAESKKNLRKITGHARSSFSNITKGWAVVKKNGIVVGARTLEQGIRSKIHMEGNSPFSKINIMADHRLKWFEKGTNVRTVKNYLGHRGVKKDVGQMKEGRFFVNAVNSTKDRVLKRMQDIIDRELTKIYYTR